MDLAVRSETSDGMKQGMGMEELLVSTSMELSDATRSELFVLAPSLSHPVGLGCEPHPKTDRYDSDLPGFTKSCLVIYNQYKGYIFLAFVVHWRIPLYTL